MEGKLDHVCIYVLVSNCTLLLFKELLILLKQSPNTHAKSLDFSEDVGSCVFPSAPFPVSNFHF